MKRVIKLTESDLQRIVKKVIQEQTEDNGEDHFLRHKTVVDYDAKPLIEWNECSSDVKNHNGPVLLMFGNPACTPCKKIKKIMYDSEEFNSWVYDNNIALLYLGCHTPHWDRKDSQKCRSKKCSNGKTMNDDYENIMELFGGNPNNTGLRMDDRWTGVPSFFMTDSSFNKKGNRIGLRTYEIKDFIKVLEGEM